MACKHKSKVWDNGWCNVACMYCTLTQESTCKHNNQTNADRIRAMSDEELAELFGAILREREIILLQQMRKQGVEASIVEMPEFTFNAHLEWLKQPAED